MLLVMPTAVILLVVLMACLHEQQGHNDNDYNDNHGESAKISVGCGLESMPA